MSFSQSLPVTAIDEAADAIDEMTPSYKLNDVAQQLFEAGKESAQELLTALRSFDTGATHVNVSIHGHGHEEGAADLPLNNLTVSVSEAATPVHVVAEDAPGDEDGA